MVQSESENCQRLKKKSLGYQKLKNNVNFRVVKKALFREQVMGSQLQLFCSNGSKLNLES